MDHDQEEELEALEGILSDPSAEPIKLSYGLLKSITDNFSQEIGRGGFGVVYQGHLRHGMVAVKRSIALNVTDKQFMDEIKCLKGANHKNIVRFLGYCADTQEEVMPLGGTLVMAGERNRLFCFEYLPNGNIRQYLEKVKSHGDNWPTRYKMIRGICQGLQYLHDKRINHLDLKPENIMLDGHMEAKITDFGLSRFIDQGQSRIITQQIRGTWRYIAPEVKDKRELSFKSDMYALGVIIIEVLTGTNLVCPENWDESLDLLDCPRARMCADIARKCTHAERDNRPTIHEVIHCMDEMESMTPMSSTTNQLVTATTFPGTELLDVYPLELRFLFKPDQEYMSCSLAITNKTDAFIYCDVTGSVYGYFLHPMSSTVVKVDIEAGEEIPSGMVESEIVMFTTTCYKDIDNFMDDVSEIVKKDTPFEDLMKAIQELLQGEVHRAALTASVIVECENPLEVHTLGKEEDTIWITWMDVHPTEPWVLVINGNAIYIWNWQTSVKVGEYNSPIKVGQDYDTKTLSDDSVAKFIAQENWAVIGDSDGSITVHTCPTMDQVKKFKAHGDGVSSLAVHPTRPFLLSYSYPISLKLWDWSQDWSFSTTFTVRSPLCQFKFNPHDTTTFAARGQDGVVEMWTIGRPKPIATTRTRDLHECSIYFTYTGRRDFIVVIEKHNTIRIWDLRREKHVYTLRNEECDYVLAACHPTRRIFVLVSECGRVEVWDSTTYGLKKAYDNITKHPIHVGFTGSGRLVIGYEEGIIVLDIDLE